MKKLKLVPIRNQKILSDCKNKVILHVGAADHPYHKEKFKNGSLFHLQLSKVSKKVIGIDVSKEAVNFLKKEGIKNIYCGDIYSLNKIRRREKFDIILIPEVIEHLPNPGKALESVKKFVKNNNKDAEIIITVPNFITWKNIIYSLLGKENVHPDHNFWFSFKTMKHLLQTHGFEIIEFSFVSAGYGKTIKKLLLKFIPYWSDSLYFRCKVVSN